MIVRGKREHGFTSMPRNAFEDTRLSFESRGALAYILVKPDNWQVHLSDLARNAGDKTDKKTGRVTRGCGRERIQRIVAELKAAGYMRYEQTRGVGNKITGGQWVIADQPGATVAEKPEDGKAVGRKSRRVGKPEGGKAVGRKSQGPENTPPVVKELIPTDYELKPKDKGFAASTDDAGATPNGTASATLPRVTARDAAPIAPDANASEQSDGPSDDLGHTPPPAQTPVDVPAPLAPAAPDAQSTAVEVHPASKANGSGSKSTRGTVQPPEYHELYAVLAEVCLLNLQTIGVGARKNLDAAAKRLLAAGTTPAQVKASEASWYRQDWRGKKGQAPTPSQIMERIGADMLPRSAAASYRPGAHQPGKVHTPATPEQLEAARRAISASLGRPLSGQGAS